ncbi:MAG: glycolate oxidase subunit GlcE [Proteobacteria bacterium]|nr:glycolate oxidase subunit GlcE [Pseudomonadota bacterium]NOG61354.1 glycolate oxidase subunit GlcE [Pseudomonadota bacterium]
MEQKIITIKEQIETAIEQRENLKIVGGNSKSFLGRDIVGSKIDMSDYTGVISYEPTELYISVKAGTLLSDVNKVLSEKNQILAFEPAEVNEKTTIGGVVATGLSGPRRPYAGSVRDFVLGISCINGLAKNMSFGGQVMKNVAGYDLSRLLTGSYGSLAVIYDVTFKVLPIPEFESSGCKQTSRQEALETMSELSVKSFPVSAACYYDGLLSVRFSGNKKVVKDSMQNFSLQEMDNSEQFWSELRNFKLPFFNSEKPIWRLSVPSSSNIGFEKDDYVIDWGGAQYWLASERPANEIFSLAEGFGGSALLFHGGDRSGDVFQPLSKGIFKLQQNLKQAFDPYRILNREKMYKTL